MKGQFYHVDYKLISHWTADGTISLYRVWVAKSDFVEVRLNGVALLQNNDEARPVRYTTAKEAASQINAGDLDGILGFKASVPADLRLWNQFD